MKICVVELPWLKLDSLLLQHTVMFKHAVALAFKHREYIKISIYAAMSVVIISGIYSYLTNVRSILVKPGTTNGILCAPNNNNNANSDYCDSVALSMADVCDKYTQFGDEEGQSFYYVFDNFFTYLINIGVNAVIYALACMVHDWTLIYYKTQINNVQFGPLDENDFYFLSKLTNYFQKKPFDLRGDCNCKKCVMFLPNLFLRIGYLFAFGMDGFLFLIVHPFVSLCSKKYPKKRFISGVCYVSSAWAGITRYGMTLQTAVLMMQAGTLSKDISSSSTQCSCSCTFVFREWDFYSYLMVTAMFVFSNFLFMLEWVNECIYGQQYLYLLSYTAPIQLVQAVNPDDVTYLLPIQNQNVNVSLPLQLKQNECDAIRVHKDEDVHHMHESDVALEFRLQFLTYSSGMYVVYLATALFIMIADNPYSYSPVIQWIAWCLIPIVALIVLAIIYVLGQYLKKQAEYQHVDMSSNDVQITEELLTANDY